MPMNEAVCVEGPLDEELKEADMWERIQAEETPCVCQKLRW
jgi:hypothetical protein